MLYRAYQIAKAIPGVKMAANSALRRLRKLFWTYRSAPDIHSKPPEDFIAFVQDVLGGEVSFSLIEIGAGDGRVLRSLAAKYPSARFVGVDIQKAAVLAGRERLAELGISNVQLFCASCLDENLQWECDYLISRTTVIYLDRLQIARFLGQKLPRIIKKALFEEIVSLTGETEVSHFFAHPLAKLAEDVFSGTLDISTAYLDYGPWTVKGKWSGARIIMTKTG